VSELERPRLLARRLQHGYVELDPVNPDRDPKITRALIAEPEPVSDDELAHRSFARQVQRERMIAEARKLILELLDTLAADATASERRRLRNVRRATLGL
jgi:hypothetical protein